jgi:hypothetical protein
MLEGVWIHDPADPETTAYQFRYGKAQRSDSLEVEAEASQYAGRVYPVVDYGEHEVETVTVRMDVPSGPSYVADLAAIRRFVQARRVLFFRDNRSRAFPANTSSVQSADQAWGAQPAFTVTRAG